jgi:hypothetical protein
MVPIFKNAIFQLALKLLGWFLFSKASLQGRSEAATGMYSPRF